MYTNPCFSLHCVRVKIQNKLHKQETFHYFKSFKFTRYSRYKQACYSIVVTLAQKRAREYWVRALLTCLSVVRQSSSRHVMMDVVNFSFAVVAAHTIRTTDMHWHLRNAVGSSFVSKPRFNSTQIILLDAGRCRRRRSPVVPSNSLLMGPSYSI